MDKIAGFFIHRNNGNIELDLAPDVNIHKIDFAGMQIFLWGIGDISKCISEKEFVLAFPYTKNLLDRNVVVTFEEDKILVENDWLGSIPVFYNNKDLRVSTNSFLVLGSDKEISEEGLMNYFDFGYSVLEQTPIKSVKFMRYYSKLIIKKNKIEIIYKKDPALENRKLLNHPIPEKEVLSQIKAYVSNVEKNSTGEIIIPTSGGYDSRLLNCMVGSKKRIKAFTYGISHPQENSYEVVNARNVTKSLGVCWEQVELEKFHNHMRLWFQLMGFAVHLHGMYHIEFYRKIQEKIKGEAILLSGIIGDAWSGRVKIPRILTVKDLPKLGYTHGAVLPKSVQKLKMKSKAQDSFFEDHKDILSDRKISVIFSMRFKLMLLSYLTILPEYFGWPVATPFLNMEIVFSMLSIPPERRLNRAWQDDYFARFGISDRNITEQGDRSNFLDYEAMKKSIPEKVFSPIKNETLSRYVDEKYIEQVNRKMAQYPNGLQEIFNITTANHRYVRGVLKKLKIPHESHFNARVSYQILKSIDWALE